MNKYTILDNFDLIFNQLLIFVHALEPHIVTNKTAKGNTYILLYLPKLYTFYVISMTESLEFLFSNTKDIIFSYSSSFDNDAFLTINP